MQKRAAATTAGELTKKPDKVLPVRGTHLHTAAVLVDPLFLVTCVPRLEQVEGVGWEGEGAALYITVRVVPANNVGLYVTAGKVPPLATARFASPTFPFDFSLTMADLTQEFSGVPAAEWNGG